MKTGRWAIALCLLGTLAAKSAVLWAVAVPPEVLASERGGPDGTIYAFILIVFVVGLGLGVWVQKKLR